MPETSFTALLDRTDAIGLLVMLTLLLMSVACWFQLLWKLWESHGERQRRSDFLAHFERTGNVAALERLGQTHPASHGDSAPARLSRAALHAWGQVLENRRLLAQGRPLLAIDNSDQFVIRTLAQSLAEEAARRDAGLTVLGTVGSAAPFVGLFGTVWGIYHALLGIGLGQGGQATLDKVAGPIGEALVMTACGLAVAIPAVLFYNWLVRRNAADELLLDGFAERLFVFLATETHHDTALPSPALHRPATAAMRTAGGVA